MARLKDGGYVPRKGSKIEAALIFLRSGPATSPQLAKIIGCQAREIESALRAARAAGAVDCEVGHDPRNRSHRVATWSLAKIPEIQTSGAPLAPTAEAIAWANPFGGFVG